MYTYSIHARSRTDTRTFVQSIQTFKQISYRPNHHHHDPQIKIVSTIPRSLLHLSTLSQLFIIIASTRKSPTIAINIVFLITSFHIDIDLNLDKGNPKKQTKGKKEEKDATERRTQFPIIHIDLTHFFVENGFTVNSDQVRKRSANDRTIPWSFTFLTLVSRLVASVDRSILSHSYHILHKVKYAYSYYFYYQTNLHRNRNIFQLLIFKNKKRAKPSSADY